MTLQNRRPCSQCKFQPVGEEPNNIASPIILPIGLESVDQIKES